MRDIGRNIRQLRMKRNMTQDDLAEKLFVTRQTVSNYETGRSRPDVEMLIRISQVLDADIQHLIYGPEPERLNVQTKALIISLSLTLVLLLTIQILKPIVSDYRSRTYLSGYSLLLTCCLGPAMWLCMGWTLAHLFGMALKKQPLQRSWVPAVRRLLLILLILWLGIAALFSLTVAVDDWLYVNHIRGEWIPYEAGDAANGQSWNRLPLPVPAWLNTLASTLAQWAMRAMPWLILPGATLWLLRFPAGKQKHTARGKQ